MTTIFSTYLQNQRLRAVAPYLQGDVLDLGCGLGRVLEWMQPGQGYVGVEGPAAFVDWLRQHHPQHEFHQRDLNTDPLALQRQFDTILMVAVIEHLANPRQVLRQIPAYLRPGGRLVITTPSPGGDRLHQLGARLGLFSKAAMEEHESIFDRQRLAALLAQNGLQLVVFRRLLLGGNQLFVCQAQNDRETRMTAGAVVQDGEAACE